MTDSALAFPISREFQQILDTGIEELTRQTSMNVHLVSESQVRLLHVTNEAFAAVTNFMPMENLVGEAAIVEVDSALVPIYFMGNLGSSDVAGKKHLPLHVSFPVSLHATVASLYAFHPDLGNFMDVTAKLATSFHNEHFRQQVDEGYLKLSDHLKHLGYEGKANAFTKLVGITLFGTVEFGISFGMELLEIFGPASGMAKNSYYGPQIILLKERMGKFLTHMFERVQGVAGGGVTLIDDSDESKRYSTIGPHFARAIMSVLPKSTPSDENFVANNPIV